MEKNQNINFFKGLVGRSTIIISALITVISLILSLFFTNSFKSSVENELIKRATALANNLAYNAQYGVAANLEEELSNLINGVINEEEIVYAYIVDTSGTIIAHNDTTYIGNPANVIGDYKEHNAQTNPNRSNLVQKESNIFEVFSSIEVAPDRNSSDEDILFPPETLGNTNESDNTADVKRLGYVHLGVSLNKLNEEIATNRKKAFYITFGIVLVGIFMTVITTRFVTRPLRELMNATQIVAQGNLDYSVDISREDEIGILAQSFNRMTSELKKSRVKIESWNRILESRVIERTKALSRKNLELRRYSEELQKALEELKTLDKSKDDFLALVSHELRTPLSSIVAYTEVLLDGMPETEEEEKKYLGIIKDESDRLTRLINNVLDLSKMEAGRMPFNFQSVKLAALIDASVAGLTGLANKHQHTIVNDLKNSSLTVNVDPDKIIQVMSNIVSNAIKYTHDGGTISISGEVKDSMVEISIADNGVGIKKKDMDKVFDKFHQIEDVDHHSEGTGLGMPISKLIIENHNGKIWLKSVFGKGATFYFTLPLQ